MNLLIYSSNSRYSNKCVGGAETALELMASKFKAAGEHVCFATLNIPGNLETKKPPIAPEDPPFQKKIINGLPIYNLESSRWPPYAHLPWKQRKAIIADRTERFLAGIARLERIDMAHSYEVKDTYAILKAKERFNLKLKVVKRVAGLFWAHALNSKFCTKEDAEWVFNSVDAVNFLSPQSRDLVFRTAEKYNLQLKPKKEIILDIGINLDVFPYSWRPKTQKTFRIVSVSRFAFYQKKPDLLIQALSTVQNKDFMVDFIGVGADQDACKALCQQLGINDHFTFHNYLDQKKIAQILSAADLFVLPSLDEGMPKALLEAMSVGVPCLASNVSPLNSYIQDGFNGFLAANTPQEWAQKLDFLFTRPEQLFQDISKRGRDFVVQNYNPDKNILLYKDEFQKLIRR